MEISTVSEAQRQAPVKLHAEGVPHHVLSAVCLSLMMKDMARADERASDLQEELAEIIQSAEAKYTRQV